jgi:hypothetical protein
MFVRRLEFLQRKSADPSLADIPTIVLSGSGRPEQYTSWPNLLTSRG